MLFKKGYFIDQLLQCLIINALKLQIIAQLPLHGGLNELLRVHYLLEVVVCALYEEQLLLLILFVR